MCLGAPCTFLYMGISVLVGNAVHVVCAMLPLSVTGERSGHDRIRERDRNSGWTH